MLYLAHAASASNPATAQFLARGLNDLTPGRMSDINALAFPTEVQPFYSAYAKSIEGFLYATSIKKKVSLTGAEAFPIPRDYIPSVPISYPPVVFKLRGKQSKTTYDAVKAKFESQGIEEIVAGKGEPTFVLKNPSFQSILEILPSLCQPQTARTTFQVQVETASFMAPIYQCIDLFLATNTYPYKVTDFTISGEEQTKPANFKLFELRIDNMNWRDGYGEKKLNKTSKEADVSSRKIDAAEENDLTPNLDGVVKPGGSVFVAKPSPYPSSTNWGLPSSVPNKGGLIFPYFDGMLQADPSDFRDIVGRHFFRCLGSNPADAYKKFRGALSDFTSTIQATRVHHMIKGVQMALDAQAQLYLLFDNSTYLGFVLLGECFRVFLRGRWYDPCTASELKAQLRKMKDLNATLDELLNELNFAKTIGGDTLALSKKDIDTPVKLARQLGKLDIDGSTDEDKEHIKETVKSISGILRRLTFPTTYASMSVKNLDGLMQQMCIGKAPDTVPIFISSKAENWSMYNSEVGIMLCAFGPTAPSFIGGKGEEVSVKSPGEEGNPFEAKNAEDKYVVDCVIVYEKPIDQAYKDMCNLLKNGVIRSDPKERAAGVRANIFRGEQRNVIAKGLMELKKRGIIGVKPAEEKKKQRVVTEVTVLKDGDVLDILSRIV